MPALLLSPLARWAALGVVLVGMAGWGWIERSGRISADLRADAAEKESASLRLTIEHMGVRRDAEDAARRDPDPAGSLRDRWSRP